MRTVVLASSSPRRQELLKNLLSEFVVVPSDYVEDMSMKLAPTELAKKLSLGKAQDVARKYSDAIVIGADTLIAFAGQVLGKPHTAESASKMLAMLNGKQHSVVTGYSVVDTKTGKEISRAIETNVSFRELTDSEIDNYINTGEPLDRAGAYAIEGRGAVLVEKIEGDYNNVVGLPISELAITLKDFGVKTLRDI